jgi:hypothetical protein
VDCLYLLTAKAFAPLEAKYFAGLVCPPNVRLGVITGNDASRIECPLIPRALTSIDAFCMSASGQFLPHAKKATLCCRHAREVVHRYADW